jgi:hypothetical protein
MLGNEPKLIYEGVDGTMHEAIAPIVALALSSLILFGGAFSVISIIIATVPILLLLLINRLNSKVMFYENHIELKYKYFRNKNKIINKSDIINVEIKDVYNSSAKCIIFYTANNKISYVDLSETVINFLFRTYNPFK